MNHFEEITRNIALTLQEKFSETLEARADEYFGEYFKHAHPETHRNLRDARSFLRWSMHTLFDDMVSAILHSVKRIDFLWNRKNNQLRFTEILLKYVNGKLVKISDREAELQVRLRNVSRILAERSVDENQSTDSEGDVFSLLDLIESDLRLKLDSLNKCQKLREKLETELIEEDESMTNMLHREIADPKSLKQIEDLKREITDLKSKYEKHSKEAEIRDAHLTKELKKTEDMLLAEREKPNCTETGEKLERHHNKLMELQKSITQFKKSEETIRSVTIKSIRSKMNDFLTLVHQMRHRYSSDDMDRMEGIEKTASNYVRVLKYIFKLEDIIMDVFGASKINVEFSNTRPILRNVLSDLIDDMQERLKLGQVENANSLPFIHMPSHPTENHSKEVFVPHTEKESLNENSVASNTNEQRKRFHEEEYFTESKNAIKKTRAETIETFTESEIPVFSEHSLGGSTEKQISASQSGFQTFPNLLPSERTEASRGMEMVDSKKEIDVERTDNNSTKESMIIGDIDSFASNSPLHDISSSPRAKREEYLAAPIITTRQTVMDVQPENYWSDSELFDGLTDSTPQEVESSRGKKRRVNFSDEKYTSRRKILGVKKRATPKKKQHLANIPRAIRNYILKKKTHLGKTKVESEKLPAAMHLPQLS